MRVFVAGGTGLLGLRVVRLLAAAGDEVVATARDDAGAGRIRRLGATPLSLDLFDERAVASALTGCAAAVRLTTRIPALLKMRFASQWVETGRLRTEGARILAEACVASGVQRYVHESVTFLYADSGSAWLDEDAPVDVDRVTPLRDALEGEASASVVTDAGGSGVVLRFASVYASDARQSLELAAAMQRRRFRLIGPSRNYMSSIHADDAASAAVAALQAPAGTYNVGDNEPMPLRENIAALADAINAPP